VWFISVGLEWPLVAIHGSNSLVEMGLNTYNFPLWSVSSHWSRCTTRTLEIENHWACFMFIWSDNFSTKMGGHQRPKSVDNQTVYTPPSMVTKTYQDIAWYLLGCHGIQSFRETLYVLAVPEYHKCTLVLWISTKLSIRWNNYHRAARSSRCWNMAILTSRTLIQKRKSQFKRSPTGVCHSNVSYNSG
jgi:hypothetical protein